MKQTDRKAFLEVVLGFAELRGKQLSAPALELYWNALKDWDLSEFKAAADHLLKNSQFMPTPYDFTQLRKAGNLTASEAWDLVLSGAPLEPNSRAERAARTCGGQRTIRKADTERDLPFVKRDFLRAYDDLTDVDSARTELPHIVNPEARIALRGPVQAGNFLPNLEPRKVESSTEGQR